MFAVYQRLPSQSVIMCCSPHRFVGRAATHYHNRALQTLIHGKECFILLTEHWLMNALTVSSVISNKKTLANTVSSVIPNREI